MATPLGLEGTTAGGDSGGPLVVNFGSGDRIVGVLHGGENPFGNYSEYGDISIWASLTDPDNIAFLEGAGIAVPEPSVCGLLLLSFLIPRRSRKR